MTGRSGDRVTHVLPAVSELTAPYWDAAREHRLVIQTCVACRALQHPPEPRCRHCHSAELDWAPMTGQAVLYSFTVVHHSVHPVTASAVPYVIALVELLEGPRLVSNLRRCEPDKIAIGMQLGIIFEDITPEISLVQFAPLGS